MPTCESAISGGMVYKPSIAHDQTAMRPLMFSNIASWNRETARLQHRDTLLAYQKTSPYTTSEAVKGSHTYSSSEIESGGTSDKSLEERLFDASATAKILTSHVSMYLREGWRDKLFYQLDNLLDPEEWDPDDKPLQRRSFDTFLKAICDIRPNVRPGLGLSYGGNLIAAWLAQRGGRLSLEFEQDGNVQVVGTRIIDGEPVHFHALATVRNLKGTLRSFNCLDWLGCD